MQEAKLQQMRFVNDASHELRAHRGDSGLCERLTAGAKTTRTCWQSPSHRSRPGEHMQELVEQLLFLARGDADARSCGVHIPT